ncbi:hypothetical protein ACF1FX_32485 [Streptomyces sp. NPDC014646]|uniref:hypothetical protein n=1 Tax=Streptomyces sp. NPDC014646 TaxID=3364877 RepID=UPI0036FB8BAE
MGVGDTVADVPCLGGRRGSDREQGEGDRMGQAVPGDRSRRAMLRGTSGPYHCGGHLGRF